MSNLWHLFLKAAAAKAAAAAAAEIAAAGQSENKLSMKHKR